MKVAITRRTTAKYTNPTPYFADLDHGSRRISAASAAVVDAVTGTLMRLARDMKEASIMWTGNDLSNLIYKGFSQHCSIDAVVSGFLLVGAAHSKIPGS